MGHSYNANSLHIVFSTKGRVPCLSSQIPKRLYPYMAQIINNQFGYCFLINGVEDHLHILCNLDGKHSVSDFVKVLKVESSKWLQANFPMSFKFHWQLGYGSFSVSKSQHESVLKYIQNQKEHHRRVSFEEEFKSIVEKYGLELRDDEFVDC